MRDIRIGGRRAAAIAAVAAFAWASGSGSAWNPARWATTPAAAQEAPARQPGAGAGASTEDALAAKIRDEGFNRSKVEETLSYLCDVIGPRLTNSPEMKRANEWTRDKMTEWGLENAKLESWGPFGRGWSLRRFSAQMTGPGASPLIAYPKAWSPAIEGEGNKLSGEVVLFDPAGPEDFERYKGKLKGAIVLSGAERRMTTMFEPYANRRTPEQLLAMANDTPRRREPAAGPPRERPDQAEIDEMRRRMAVRARALDFLVEEGAGVIVEPSSRGEGGTLFVQSASVPRGEGAGAGARPWSPEAKTVPQVVMAAEHYNRLVRMIKLGQTPSLEIELAVEFHDDDPMGYNTTAELVGTDPELKDEIVMCGAHMDSWHGSTGATDNAAGVVVCMEAVRILKAIDAKPRRTIRVGLWSGEEQGLLGSRAYVAQHFGSRNEPKPEYDKFSGYFNYDNGTGKIRGVHMQGNDAVRPLFRNWLAPFADLEASTLTLSNTGGTDHLSFDAVGLPGFQFIQDPIDYDYRTHHSNQDSYERVLMDDIKQSSVIMAQFLLRTANLDEKLPRKPAPSGGERGRAAPGGIGAVNANAGATRALAASDEDSHDH